MVWQDGVGLQKRIDKVLENKKWTVAALRDLCQLLCLEKSGDRETIVKRILEFLNHPSGSVSPTDRPTIPYTNYPACHPPLCKVPKEALLFYVRSCRTNGWMVGWMDTGADKTQARGWAQEVQEQRGQ